MRSKYVMVRLSEAEHAAIREEAHQRRTSMAALAKARILGGEIVSKSEPEVTAAMDRVLAKIDQQQPDRWEPRKPKPSPVRTVRDVIREKMGEGA